MSHLTVTNDVDMSAAHDSDRPMTDDEVKAAFRRLFELRRHNTVYMPYFHSLTDKVEVKARELQHAKGNAEILKCEKAVTHATAERDKLGHTINKKNTEITELCDRLERDNALRDPERPLVAAVVKESVTNAPTTPTHDDEDGLKPRG